MLPAIDLIRIDGKVESLTDYNDKTLLIVNVASNCGFTPQYRDLQQLYLDLNGKGLEILAFPCNQFGSQEPGSSKEIQNFCTERYAVTFPVFSKTDVNGADEHKIYTYLKKRAPGVLGTTKIKWNFTKFLIDYKNNLVKRYAPQTAIIEIRKDLVEIISDKISSSYQVVLIILVSLLLSSCSSIKYNYGLINNHLSIIKNAQPIDEILEENTTNPELKTKLRLVNKIKDFAYSELHFRKTKSYSTYSDILRNAVVWNVVATKENSFELKEWCYIFIGCFNYRGFFNKKEAEKYANDLMESEDLEVAILPVAAYSTLGWSDFLGGDPVLNTFIWNDEIDLVRLLMHEMAHQQVFVKNDTLFNESFASFVEDAGSLQWIKRNGDSDDLILYDKKKRKRDEVGELLRSSRENLEILYSQNLKKKKLNCLKKKYF